MRFRFDRIAGGMLAGLLVASPLSAADDSAVASARAGMAAFQSGDVRAARDRFAFAIRIEPDRGDWHALMGRAAVALEDGKTAEAELGRAQSLGYPSLGLAHLLAEALLLQHQPAAALETAAPAQVAAQFSAYAARVRALAQLALGRNDAARAEAARAIALDGRAGAGWLTLARVDLAQGDRNGAVKAVEHAVGVAPRDAAALVLAGNLVRDGYGLLPALPWYDRALAIQPGRIDALFEKAATLGDAGRMTDMLATTRALMHASPGNAEGWYLQAVIAARADDWDLARRLLFRVGNRLDGQPSAVMLRAMAAIQAGAPETAIALLRPLIDAQPGNAKLRRLLGLALWRSHDFNGTVDALQPLAARGDPYALMLIGRACEAAGNYAAAANALQRASTAQPPLPDPRSLAAVDDFLSASPQNIPALRTAADRALANGQWPVAAARLTFLRQRLGDRDPVLLDNAGWALAGAGDVDGAVIAAAAAYAIAPLNALATASYGSFLRRAGHPEAALPVLEKAVALAPNEPRFRAERDAARAALGKTGASR